ncbi:MAG TPA: hypothetical protein VJ574_04240 [Candidatus Bathyarchaeia archaeon]|nr:hypothetical protein [Candidatus Bathyarchaeia archaeon]
MQLKTAINLSRALAAIFVIVAVTVAGIMAISLSTPSGTPTEVPYVGMTLVYWYNKTTDIGGSLIKDASHIVINYLSKTPEGLFRVDAHEELFTFDLLVNATTRQYAKGAENGSYVGHLVPLGLQVGDVVMIYSRRNFTCISTDYAFQLQGVTLRASELVYHESWSKPEADYNQTIYRYFDSANGIMLMEDDKDLTHNVGYGKITHDFETTIVDDGTDNDKDGVTDFRELFMIRTDPLKPDTDRDLWVDTLDPWPNDILLPNGLVLGFLIFATMSAFYISWRLTKKRM